VLDFGRASDGGSDPTERAKLETEWLTLTQATLPALAKTHRWPVSADHCFMRILLDAVHKARWDSVVTRRPAYMHIGKAQLIAATALGQQAAVGEADLWALNARSLRWRGKG
jgi:hypothetical protein